MLLDNFQGHGHGSPQYLTVEIPVAFACPLTQKALNSAKPNPFCAEIAIVTEQKKPQWTKPELIKLGTLKDVASGAVQGSDGQSNGNSTKFNS